MSNIIKLRNDKAYGVVYDLIQSGRYRFGLEPMPGDLHDAYGLTGHPKSNLLWIMAMYYGNSSGPEGILRWYDELSNLLV